MNILFMKGVELPINILVVVSIAVIVLLGMVALYILGIGPFNRQITQDAAKVEACKTYTNQYPTQCADWSKPSVTYQQTYYTLQNFTEKFYSCTEEGCARRLCSCPGY
jgi:hypothetical protein